MISVSDFRNGVTFDMDGKVMQIIEFQHVKPGKGAAFVRTKMKNVITGAVTETSFNPTAKFESATIDRKTMEYSYNDGNLYYFMDPETYDLVPIDESALGSNFRFVKENMECTISSYKGKVFQVEPPTFVELEVAETDPGFAGNTATNATKPATLETAPRSRCRCSSTPATVSASTPAWASISSARRAEKSMHKKGAASGSVFFICGWGTDMQCMNGSAVIESSPPFEGRLEKNQRAGSYEPARCALLSVFTARSPLPLRRQRRHWPRSHRDPDP